MLQAGTRNQGGEIFVLDMGDPARIIDLSRDIIAMSGFKPFEDLDIDFTGLRPGEKLFEKLGISEEHAVKPVMRRFLSARSLPILMKR